MNKFSKAQGDGSPEIAQKFEAIKTSINASRPYTGTQLLTSALNRFGQD